MDNIDYVSVNEKDFWKKESLTLTVNGRILDENIKKQVESKVSELNSKIDQMYNVSLLDFNWTQKVSSEEIKKLSSQLKEVIKWFNETIWKMKDDYIWDTKNNLWKIKDEISNSFTWKTLFTEKSISLASAIKWYASSNRQEVNDNMWEWNSRPKENQLPLY